ncbi:MAG: hypothetical protein IPH13_20185 [Planctomycetes bacterium]|nr:hypothetical protein [Planctomycetota bacterium]
MNSPITDFWSTHLSMPLGRHMTQTFAADIAPGDTFLMLAARAGEDRAKLRELAGKYVTYNEQRPDKMYSEAVLPDGSKIGGYDHGHFGFSVLSEIIQLWPDEDEVTVRVQVDNLTAAPTIMYVKHNGNTIDYGDISATQLDADSWVVEYVLIPLAVGHYECYVGNSGGTVVAADFWSAFS